MGRPIRFKRRDMVINMVGQTVGDYQVARAAPAVNGNARWYCVCPQGHVRYFIGAYLRQPGVAPRCKECTLQAAPSTPPTAA